MDDLPEDASQLRERLKTARVEYKKLLGDVVRWKERATYAEHVLNRVRATLNGEAGPDIEGLKARFPTDPSVPPLDHPLFKAIEDNVSLAAGRVTADMRCRFMLRLLTRIVKLFPPTSGEAAPVPTDAGSWLRILAEIRTELALTQE